MIFGGLNTCAGTIVIWELSPLTRYLLDILPGKSHTLDGFVRSGFAHRLCVELRWTGCWARTVRRCTSVLTAKGCNV